MSTNPKTLRECFTPEVLLAMENNIKTKQAKEKYIERVIKHRDELQGHSNIQLMEIRRLRKQLSDLCEATIECGVAEELDTGAMGEGIVSESLQVLGESYDEANKLVWGDNFDETVEEW